MIYAEFQGRTASFRLHNSFTGKLANFQQKLATIYTVTVDQMLISFNDPEENGQLSNITDEQDFQYFLSVLRNSSSVKISIKLNETEEEKNDQCLKIRPIKREKDTIENEQNKELSSITRVELEPTKKEEKLIFNKVHQNVNCLICLTLDIRGFRYACLECDMSAICQRCFLENKHYHNCIALRDPQNEVELQRKLEQIKNIMNSQIQTDDINTTQTKLVKYQIEQLTKMKTKPQTEHNSSLLVSKIQTVNHYNNFGPYEVSKTDFTNKINQTKFNNYEIEKHAMTESQISESKNQQSQKNRKNQNQANKNETNYDVLINNDERFHKTKSNNGSKIGDINRSKPMTEHNEFDSSKFHDTLSDFDIEIINSIDSSKLKIIEKNITETNNFEQRKVENMMSNKSSHESESKCSENSSKISYTKKNRVVIHTDEVQATDQSLKLEQRSITNSDKSIISNSSNTGNQISESQRTTRTKKNRIVIHCDGESDKKQKETDQLNKNEEQLSRDQNSKNYQSRKNEKEHYENPNQNKTDNFKKYNKSHNSRNMRPEYERQRPTNQNFQEYSSRFNFDKEADEGVQNVKVYKAVPSHIFAPEMYVREEVTVEDNKSREENNYEDIEIKKMVKNKRGHLKI